MPRRNNALNIPLDPALTAPIPPPTPPPSSPNDASLLDPAVAEAVERFKDSTALAVQVVSLTAEVVTLKRRIEGGEVKEKKKTKKKAEYILGGEAGRLSPEQRVVRAELQVFFFTCCMLKILTTINQGARKSRDGETHWHSS